MGRTLRGWLGSTLALTVLLEALLVAAIVWWPNFKENLASVKLIAKPLPMLGDMLEQVERLGVDAYVVGQHFFKACNTLGLAAAVIFAASAVAGEVQRGTLEIFLMRPVPRWRLCLERYLAGQLALWLAVFATTLTIPALLTRIDETISLPGLLLCAAQQALFLGAWFALSFVLSCAGSQPARITLAVLFFSTFEFAIYLVKTLTDWSLFRLTDMRTLARVLTDGRLEPGILWPLLAINLLGYLLGALFLSRRVP